ncbi:MAG: glycosyltransferase family 2 protein [Amphiplicatus sp.]
MAQRDFNLWTFAPTPDLQRFENISSYARKERIPWRRIQPGIHEELRAYENWVEKAPFPLRKMSFVPRRLLARTLEARFRPELIDASANALRRGAPAASAFRLMTLPQQAIAAGFCLAAAAALAVAPLTALIAFNLFVTLYFLAMIFFRVHLTFVSFASAPPRAECGPLAEERLPVITLLLPVYDEAASLPILAEAIDALDYPPDKLDIKLLLEADDQPTIAEARRLGLDRRYDCLLMPASAPRTKPKACNYALYLARGDLIVIYDAEDAPEKDQLRKAAAAFAASDEKLACVQARLNFYNADENWLTRLFTLEYSLWFDSLLPALERSCIPIPLGGTSNFFRTKTLIAVGGWDPYNVTEDADLGLRLARRGFRTEILDSTTYEEANCNIGNWIRQRSRWMKGYMQTWLVHMREPSEFFRVAGWRGLLATHLFVAGNFFSALINPILWTVFVLWLATRATFIDAIFPGPLLALNLFALLAGNCFFIYLGIIAPLKRGRPELSLSAFMAPLYWWLTSFAAYRALWQLFTRPFHWEKTVHVLSAAAKHRRNDALKKNGIRS